MNIKPKISGHVTITKKFVDNRPDEVVVDDDNIITIGLATLLADVMEGAYDPSYTPEDIILGWLQLGTSAQDNWATKYLYELSSPATIPDYGDHTNLHLEEFDQLIYEDPINQIGVSSKENTFIDLRKPDNAHVTKMSDSTVCFTVIIDENTLKDNVKAGIESVKTTVEEVKVTAADLRRKRLARYGKKRMTESQLVKMVKHITKRR